MRRGVTPGTARRLARYLDVSPAFWLNLQLRWDLYHATRFEARKIEAIEPRHIGLEVLRNKPTEFEARRMADIPRKPIPTGEDAASFDGDLPHVVEWESFYAEGTRTPPFLRNVPDESLVGYVEQGRFKSGRAIDLGCGIGRNAIYLAKAGFRVDAIDLSRTAITRGRQSAGEGRVRVKFMVGSVFDIRLRENHYDVAYDSGLFHHLPPHRRPQYLDTVRRALKTDGFFGITCFDTTGGQPVEDREIYERGKMPPGIGYSEDRLRGILQRFFEIVELRPMKVCPEDAEVLGMPGLWTVLMKPNRSASL